MIEWATDESGSFDLGKFKKYAEKFAAEQLVEYLKEMTGEAIQIVSDATGIENDVRWTTEDGRNVYDLKGQKVSQPKNGIYIEQNGEKAEKRVYK